MAPSPSPTGWSTSVPGGPPPRSSATTRPTRSRDPLGRSSRFYRRTAEELAKLTDQIAWFVGAVVPAPADVE